MQLCLLYTNITFCKGISVHLGGILVNSGGISVNQGYFGNSMYRVWYTVRYKFTSHLPRSHVHSLCIRYWDVWVSTSHLTHSCVYSMFIRWQTQHVIWERVYIKILSLILFILYLKLSNLCFTENIENTPDFLFESYLSLSLTLLYDTIIIPPAEQNFMKLSGIVHYMMPYCTSYFKFLFDWFWGFPEQTRTLPYKT